MESLVTTEWLAGQLGEPGLTILDASWHMPASGRNGRAEFLEAHIPGARFLDIDEVSDASDPAPHAMPGPQAFSEAMERIGVGQGDRIVVYDNSPIHTAPRGWFMLRHFGAKDVAVLDGGLPKWVAEGRPIESGEAEPRAVRFVAEAGSKLLAKEQVLTAPQLVDARGKGRFEGSEPEPRAGIASGHIPGACNLPFGMLYTEDGTLKPKDQLRRLFAEAGLDPAKPFTASCGSGVTATSLIFAAHLLGNDEASLYDGSWTEWGADPATPKALGPA